MSEFCTLLLTAQYQKVRVNDLFIFNICAGLLSLCRLKNNLIKRIEYLCQIVELSFSQV